MNKSSNKNFVLKTKKGYSLFEVSSALQKEIRRGNWKNALYWAYELEKSNYHKYFFKRIQIIAMEDIGIANPNLLQQIQAIKAAYYELKKAKSKETILCIAHAVILCCFSKKSRLSDWAKNWMYDLHDTHNLKIPDYALDIHTKRGKKMGKTIEDFLNKGSKLDTPKESPQQAETNLKDFLSDLWLNKADKLKQIQLTATKLPTNYPDYCFAQNEKKESKQTTLFDV